MGRPSVKPKKKINEERAEDLAALDRLRTRAVPPEGASDAIPASPARGPVDIYRPVETVLTDAGPRVRREVLIAGAPVRLSSALARIERASRNRKGGLSFSNAQHSAAAEYQDLFHRVNGGRVKCSDLEATGGGGADGVMDAAIGDIQRLRRISAALGYRLVEGRAVRIAVIQPRGATAHAGRVSIWADDLVHWVLIREQPMTQLLVRHGWARQAVHLRRLVDGLMAALDRSYGL